MKFEDDIQVKALFYGSFAYAVINNTAYKVDAETGRITPEIADVDLAMEQYDRQGYPIEPTEEWVDFSRCFISFNSAATKVRLNDGREYIYSYYCIIPLKKDIYHLIPREGEYVHIHKADDTIDAELQVKGFVTYKKRYLKIWL